MHESLSMFIEKSHEPKHKYSCIELHGKFDFIEISKNLAI